MPNYFNTIFDFGEKTKVNFINRKFQCPYSFIHLPAWFSFGKSRGGSSPRWTRNISRSTAISERSPRPKGAARGGL